MNKSNLVARLSVLTIALTLVTTSLIGGTLAKYTTTVTGDGSATVAKWSFKATSGGQTITTINLGETADTAYLAKERIAPGSKGSFNIEIDATGTETGLEYVISLGNVENPISSVQFCKDEACKSPITISNSGDVEVVKKAIAADASTKKVTETIYWQWKTTTDEADTTLGENTSSPMIFDIKVTGTQTVEANPAP